MLLKKKLENKMKYLIVIIIIISTIASYVRLAHVHPLFNIPDSNSNQLSRNGFVFIKTYSGSTDEFYKVITKIALATPRTLLLSNDPLQFVTRSKLLGFPDITAIVIQDKTLIIYATSVFGRFDFGVNRARALRWISLIKSSLPMDTNLD